MATLLELTQQVDPGTVADEGKLGRDVQLMTPQQLYELWERQHWASQTVDLTRDPDDWATLTDAEREESLWTLSSFFVGEERVATQFSGLVMAYEDEQEEAFLTTQQVDEARHMQFFDRWYREVPGYGDESISGRLELARRDVSDAFLELFDGVLVDAGKRLIDDPQDVDAKIDYVVTYHLLIEGVLALTGQHFMTDYFEKRGILPGFVEGFTKISRDEHRHVAYGTWFLQQKARDERHAKRIQDRLAELLPITAGVLVPPGKQLGDDYTFMGYTNQEQAEWSFAALTRRLKVIGVGLPVPV
ncbi:MAG TPA: ribonucleotide-diphosphate reductase subunit beta [Thermoleophilaceae bacterium]|nr:ribonucleotide-diphosphate reductase subunit beta [Thermoleophilaceae bacterium]